MLTDLMRSDQLRSEWSLPSTCLLAFLIGKNRFILIFLWFHVWFVCRYAMRTHLSSGIHYVTFRVFSILPDRIYSFYCPSWKLYIINLCLFVYIFNFKFERGTYATCTSPIMHLICPPTFCITFVFHFSWVLQSWKQCLCKILGANKVHHIGILTHVVPLGDGGSQLGNFIFDGTA